MTKIQICSVAPVTFRMERPSYNFSKTLHACLPPQEYSSVWIEDMQDVKVIHIGGCWTSKEDIDRIPVEIPAEQIVADFFRAEQMKEKGCFIPAGAKPTEAELEAAHEARTTHMLQEVNDADKVYGQLGPAGLAQISDYAKRCAKELGLTPNWVVTMKTRQMDCPACGESIKATVAVCKNCGCVVDRAKAKELGMLEEKNKGGRPKKEKTSEVAA